ncbi:MAG: hypothetical protein MJ186_06490, partial [Clostridia bacterium]|nr:hypothetical protein [Clostridia bacterium]
VVVDEYIYTEPVDPEFLVGSWAFYEGNSFSVDIEEDMSFVMFISGEDGTTQHIYCGNVELSVFDEKHSSGKDYIRFVLDHEKSKAYAGGDFADPYFDEYESAGDYIVRWCETFENYSDAMVLVQVNNGDSVCGWYLDTNALDLTKVESVG